jgi:GNAT superfamily N-acetyltransferase
MTTIRDLRAEDRSDWNGLWAGYLHFYRGEDEVSAEVTEQTFSLMTEQRDGCFGLAAEADDGTVVGLAHCIVHRTTWSLGPTCYLEDLFVDRGHRGSGAAKLLIQAAGERAHAQGSGLLYWHTQAFNSPARSLYDTVASLTSFVHYERSLG